MTLTEAAVRGLSRDQAQIVAYALRGYTTAPEAMDVVGGWEGWDDVCLIVVKNIEDFAAGKVTLELEVACEQEAIRGR